jgi:hypothetical protein
MAAIRYPRIFAGPDGESHFEDLEVTLVPTDFVPGRPVVDLADGIPTREFVFTRLAPGWAGSWHPTPRRQFCVTFSGTFQLTTSDGESRRFSAGGVFLLDDTTGKGHDTQVLGPDEWCGVLVPLSDQPSA